MPRRSQAHEQRDAAAAVLRSAGTPQRMAEVARRAGIPMGSSTHIFKHPRFRVTRDKLLWLAGELDPRFPGEAAPEVKAVPVQRSHRESVDELRRLLRTLGPMRLAELAFNARLTPPTCARLLRSRDFERDENGLYWLTHRTIRKIGHPKTAQPREPVEASQGISTSKTVGNP